MIASNRWLRDEGYRANIDLPEIAGSFSGRLLIVSGGRCVWDDLETINPHSFDVMAVNDIGMHLPFEIRHWFSLHGDQIPVWVKARSFRYKNYDSRLETHSCRAEAHVKHVWPWPQHGTSGLNACYTGIGLGYDEILVAGMPLDDSGHYFDPPEGHQLLRFMPQGKWSNFTREAGERIWGNAWKNVLKDKVKFLSGRMASR